MTALDRARRGFDWTGSTPVNATIATNTAEPPVAGGEQGRRGRGGGDQHRQRHEPGRRSRRAPRSPPAAGTSRCLAYEQLDRRPTSATPATDAARRARSVGIGASLALNIVSRHNRRRRSRTAPSLTGAGSCDRDRQLAAHDHHHGAERGGGLAWPSAPRIAIAIASDQTTARIGSDCADAQCLRRSRHRRPAGSLAVVSEADAKAADNGGSVGIGATVVVNVAQDSFLADLDRNVNGRRRRQRHRRGDRVAVRPPPSPARRRPAPDRRPTRLQPRGSNGTADKETSNQFSFAQNEGGSDSPDVPAPPSSEQRDDLAHQPGQRRVRRQRRRSRRWASRRPSPSTC